MVYQSPWVRLGECLSVQSWGIQRRRDDSADAVHEMNWAFVVLVQIPCPEIERRGMVVTVTVYLGYQDEHTDHRYLRLHAQVRTLASY